MWSVWSVSEHFGFVSQMVRTCGTRGHFADFCCWWIDVVIHNLRSHNRSSPTDSLVRSRLGLSRSAALVLSSPVHLATLRLLR